MREFTRILNALDMRTKATIEDTAPEGADDAAKQALLDKAKYHRTVGAPLVTSMSRCAHLYAFGRSRALADD
jgi:hypothetical protein